MKRVGNCAALAGLLGGLAALGACSGAQSPEAAVEDMYRAVDAGHCVGFSARFTEPTRRMTGDKLDAVCLFSAQQDREKADAGRFKALHVLQKTADGDQVAMRVQPEMRDGSMGAESQFRLVREGGEWKIEPVR